MGLVFIYLKAKAMTLYQRKNGVWYVQFNDKNRHPTRKRISLETRNKRVAREKAEYLEMRYFKGEFDPWLDESIERLTLQEAQRRVIDEHYSKMAESTLELAHRVYRYFRESIGHEIMLEHVGAKHVRQFTYGYDETAGQYTFYNYIHAFFEFAVKRDWIDVNPCEKVKTPTRQNTKRREIRKDEFKVMLANAREYLGPLMQLMWYTGLRPGEAVSLPWSHVDFENQIIHIQKFDLKGVSFTPKRAKRRDVPMPTPLMNVLYDWRERFTEHVVTTKREPLQEFVFQNTYARPLTVETAAYLFRDIRNEHLPFVDNIEISLYSFRHAALTNMLRKGINLEYVKRIAGHSNISTTQLYLHADTNDLVNAINSVYDG